MPVKEETVKKFIDGGGYEIVGTRDGTLKGVADAARQIEGLSERTIRHILAEYPTKEAFFEPKYESTYERTIGFQKFKELYGRNKLYPTHNSIIKKAWLYLGGSAQDKKDPISWSEADWSKIWFNSESPFIHADLKGVPENTATAFHNLMRATGKTNLLLKYKGKKFPKGKKKQWFLDEDDIKAMLNKAQEFDLLVLLSVGIVKGARISSLLLDKPPSYNEEELSSSDYEPKLARAGDPYVIRWIPEAVMKLVQRYIKDCGIKADQPLFPDTDDKYRDRLKDLAKIAEVEKEFDVTTHILKHTFVTQASRHGVPAEIVSEQCHTELRTLEAHYRAKDEKKTKFHLLGTPMEQQKPFSQWISDLGVVMHTNYDRILYLKEVKP